MKQRIQALRRAMRDMELDGALITSGVNIRYASGFTSSDGAVLATQDGLWLFTDFRYTIQAREQLFEGYTLVETTASDMYGAIGETLKKAGVKTLGFERAAMTLVQYDKLAPLAEKLVSFSEALGRLRQIKSAEEIASLQKAQAIADRAFEDLLKRVRPGMTERETAAELLYVCSRLGSEGPSFEPIVGSGPNGAMCHAVPSERKLRSGDLVVLDFGCMAEGYCSDMTRTFGIGRIDAELLRVYEIVREAQRLALDGLRAGLSCRALDALARDHIAAKGYGAAFGHSLGHGFGLEIHEPPTASMRSDEVFRPGMTITIEPGIYLEGRGGVRIEDCCVVTEEGCVNFARSTKDLIIL
ncbi:MAG: Xaa-Pro peptidase family protein [Clostridia bacterium]|nr:Xaa-Pro peptidase family protein [Clostridia bacterium]